MVLKRGTKRASIAKDTPKSKCARIANVLEDTATLPASTRQMLGGMVGLALETYKEDRHEYQNKIVAMVEQSLGEIQKHMQQEIQTAQAKVDNADNDRKEREQKRVDTDAALSAAKDAVSAKKTAVAEAKDAEKKAAVGVAEAEAAQKSGDAAVEEVISGKQKLEEVSTVMYAALKEGTAGSNSKKFLSQVETAGKKFAFDQHMLNSLPRALKAQPDKRSDFDGVVMKSFEDAVAAKLADMTKQIEEATPAKEARAAAVDAAKGELSSAEAAHAAAKDALAEAETAVKNADKDLKAALKSCHSFWPDVEKAADHLDSCKMELSSLQEGALVYFAELKELAPPPPEPEPVEEVEEAAAEAPPSQTAGDETSAAPPAE